MDDIQTRDEPANTIRTRLDALGVYDDLAKLPGWQRAFIFEALSAAHVRDRGDHDTLAGARYLQDLADTYARARPNNSDRLVVDILQRAATSHVHL